MRERKSKRESEREIPVWNISNALDMMLLRMLYVLFLGQEDMCRMIIKFSKSCAWKWKIGRAHV